MKAIALILGFALLAACIDPQRRVCLKERCEYEVKDCSRDNDCTQTIRDCMKVRRETKSIDKFEECLAQNSNSKRIHQCMKNKCPHDDLSLLLI